MIGLYLYVLWYTFYGQFVFLDRIILWLLEMTVNGNTFGNPFYGKIGFGDSIYPMWLFLVSGFAWDLIIVGLLQMNFPKSLKNVNVLDYEN